MGHITSKEGESINGYVNKVILVDCHRNSGSEAMVGNDESGVGRGLAPAASAGTMRLD